MYTVYSIWTIDRVDYVNVAGRNDQKISRQNEMGRIVMRVKRREVLSQLVVKNGKLSVNGEQVFAMHSRPMYYESGAFWVFLIKVAGGDETGETNLHLGG